MNPQKLRQDEVHAVLFVGPDRSDLNAIHHCLASDKRTVLHAYWARTLPAALASLGQRNYQAVLLDPSVSGSQGGQALEAVRAVSHRSPIMVLVDSEDQAASKTPESGAIGYLVRGSVDFRALSGILTSLIDRAAAEEARFAAQARADVALDAIVEAVLGTDAAGRVTTLNLGAERLTGWSRQAAIGRAASEIFQVTGGDCGEPARDLLQLAMRHDRAVASPPGTLLVRKDGLQRPIEGEATPIHDSSGDVTGAVMVFRDATARRDSQLAQHDFLTDLPGRVLFDDRLDQAIAMARRHQRHLGLLVLDCDDFRTVNDARGQDVGDVVLQSVARRLVTAIRVSDTVCRQGDEFLILLAELEQPEDAAICADKVLRALAPPHHVGQRPVEVTVSIGVAVYPGDGRNAAALLKGADLARHAAKEAGGNACRTFRSDMKTRAVDRQSAEGSLLRGLERNEFSLHYQPRVSLATGAILSVEALIRWNHPERGLVPPVEFVPIAEESGLIVPIGRWVLHEACRQAARWRDAGLKVGPMAVNVSAVEFRSAGYLDGIRALLSDRLIAADQLELELTETVLMQDSDITRGLLQDLRDLGISLTLDDFGTGFSSLTYLQRFPINTLKIDRSFVRELPGSADDRTLVSAIIGMGRSLGRTVIAEGIETAEQLDVLRGLSCEEGQGFHFCRPLAADDFVAYLATSPHGGATAARMVA